MPNLASVLKDEVSHLARKEIKGLGVEGDEETVDAATGDDATDDSEKGTEA